MTRQLTASLTAAAGKLRDVSPWVWLLEIEIPTTPATRYRLAANPEAIVFGGQTYSAFPFSVGEIQTTAEGDIPTVEVSVDNAVRAIGFAVEQYDGLTGQKARLLVVNTSDLTNPASAIVEDVDVQSANVSGQSVTLTLAAYSLYRIMIPGHRYVSRGCRWQFQSAECGYVAVSGATDTVGGGFTFCRKNLAQCRQRGADELARGVTVLHPRRIGGYPGIPRKGGSL